jgi:hypothetical protein
MSPLYSPFMLFISVQYKEAFIDKKGESTVSLSLFVQQSAIIRNNGKLAYISLAYL